MNFELLKTLCETPGIPSREEPIRQVVAESLRPLVDTLDVDAMGNLIGHRLGEDGGPRVMIAAHMDEIGFMVKHIDNRGFLKLLPVGGWDPRNLVSQRVFVHSRSGQRLPGVLMPGTKPPHLQTPEESNKALKIEDMFVDLGLPGEKVKELVEIGDMVTMDRTCTQMGDMVVSKTLDDRLMVFVMIEALRKLERRVPAHIFAVATTQEEVGLRGATTAAFALEPDIGIALDVTLAVDFPGAPESEQVTRLGEGVAIKIVDSSLICHPKLVRHFRDVAEKRQIKYQLEMLPRGGTDAGGIQRSRGGVPSFTLSVPVRYVHTVNEMAHVEDIQGAIDLLAAYLEEAHTRHYDYRDELNR
ncbi:MAG TPA: M42 family metallopeptidase [Chthonomonas sp.]|uniref:M42 family metallopeptidase n=1 Tax=Chthonomonas sp. TaxID=2282153 RepID=UPI002B4B0285|nr:M42 family metallopeptidase [Chthonomonas sp.]HLI47861.1 M42 family metallopeptidase [Chthonomonas sp.]